MKVFISHAAEDSGFVSDLVSAIRAMGHEVSLSAEASDPADISAAIRSADAIVAVVVAGNVNIWFEMGLAAGANVPMLIAAREKASLPPDIASVPYVRLSGDQMRDVKLVAHRIAGLEGNKSRKTELFNSAEAALQAASVDPQVLESLAADEFQELLAQLFKDRGFIVETTTTSRDNCVDLVIKSERGRDVTFVEVKKVSQQSRVTVEAVRSLLSAVISAGASRGLLVSTAPYTAAATAFAAGGPILLKSFQDVLAARSKEELIL